MGALPLLVALAAVGGQLTFFGAITTPTASTDPSVYTATRHAATRAVKVGRFDGPPRRVRLVPAQPGNAPPEVVVTYL